MFEEIMDYIEKKKLVSVNEITSKFKIDREMLMYILEYARKRKIFNAKIQKSEVVTCEHCLMKKHKLK